MSVDDSDFSEKERVLIENMAHKIVDRDMEFFAVFILETSKPVVWIAGELGHFFLAPLLPLLDDVGYDFIDTFEQRSNVDMLIRRVKQLVKEKEKEERPSPWDKIKSRLNSFQLFNTLKTKFSFKEDI